MKGKVKFFNEGKGYGFIEGDDGKDYYLHATKFEGIIDDLQVGALVEFTPLENPKAKGPSAMNAKVLK